MVVNARSGLAPSVAAASSSAVSTARKPATSGCTANGKLYSTDPTTSPEKENASGCPSSRIINRPGAVSGPSATSR